MGLLPSPVSFAVGLTVVGNDRGVKEVDNENRTGDVLANVYAAERVLFHRVRVLVAVGGKKKWFIFIQQKEKKNGTDQSSRSRG